ncbi:MAG TPA: permease-like cell division protein FtsX [Patescibacteria group bacterium]
MPASLLRALKYAFQNFWRNIWLSAITISIVVLALISINFLIILNVITKTGVTEIEDKVDISVYFRPEVSENIIFEIKSKLLTLKNVKEIIYISREEALASFKSNHQSDPQILKSLDEIDDNPLGATLIVKAKSTSDYPPILKVLNDLKYDDYIWDKDFEENEKIIQRISTISSRAKSIGLTVSVIFMMIALVVVYNTIRINIYTQRQEIGIMKLVGATNWFVRAPYLIDGLFYSLIGMIVTIVLIYPALGFLQPYMTTFFENSNFSLLAYFNQNFAVIFGLELLAMMFLNSVSGFVATSKYLKV